LTKDRKRKQIILDFLRWGKKEIGRKRTLIFPFRENSSTSGNKQAIAPSFHQLGIHHSGLRQCNLCDVTKQGPCRDM